MKKFITLLTIVFFLGCSAFRPVTETLNITCNEPDAIVMINGQRYTAPAQVNVKRNRDTAIQAYKEGYVPISRTIGHHFNGTGALDAAGTLLILLPGIGLFFPGAWSVDETDINLTLYPTGEKPH